MNHRTLLPLSILGISIVAAIGSPCPVIADSFRLEAEGFTLSGNYGGYLVLPDYCAGASGGRGVKGVDSPGDWMAWRHEFTTRTCFVDSLRTQGVAGLFRSYVVLYEPDDPVTATSADTMMTPVGGGIG